MNKMQKKILFALLAIFSVLLLANTGSAYHYDNYERARVVKETYDRYGYSYTERNIDSDPWGKVVTYKKVEDYDRYSPNKVYRYWDDGPRGYSGYNRYEGYSSSDWHHLGYRYDDAWKRNYYGTSYRDYYYKPVYRGGYWDHSYYPGW